MAIPLNPLDALKHGQWFKLICGASYQDVSKIRNLSLVYSLAGADCIDVAADLAVVQAATEGINASRVIAPTARRHLPWLMVSFNDGQDPHFRKAWFDPQSCPTDCPRPCELVCPADAILRLSPAAEATIADIGIITERCYGCGRCLPVCPHGLLEAQSFTVPAGKIIPQLLPYIDAIEIHTQMGRQDKFQNLWQQLAPYISQLQLVAISCPDSEPKSNAIIGYLAQLYELMIPKPNQLLWQTDGRSMSGDIGKGTTLATIRLAEKVLNARLPGYVQLAGGTNDYTVTKLRSLNLLKSSDSSASNHQTKSHGIHGIAYGSYARRLINPGDSHLENQPEHLCQQVRLAQALVSQIKADSSMAQLSNQSNCATQTSVANVPP
ncbi:MAG: 4Fe-4S binding protein [Leptolyngbyaceae cyanobacterium MAG.088]|nr:4Fe-4S binding protein [Leptolyngbyaceae cyanobacterium MAG.088]